MQNNKTPAGRRLGSASLVMALGAVVLVPESRADTVVRSPEGAQAGDARAAREVVYKWRKVVDMAGTVDEAMVVTTLADELTAGRVRIDLEQMVDEQGRSYLMTADAYQRDDGGPVTYEVELARFRKEIASDTALDNAFRQDHPAAKPGDRAAWRTERARARAAHVRRTEVPAELQQWLQKAPADERVEVTVSVAAADRPFRLPRVVPGLFAEEPAFALSQMKARVLALEARKNELEALHAPLVESTRAAGGDVIKSHWLVNAFKARVTPQALRMLAADPRVERVERVDRPIPDANNLDDMRVATQAVQFHAAGFLGETPSGASMAADMMLAIIDTDIDNDHPAWLDQPLGTTRLDSIWREAAGVWGQVGFSAAGDSHGTKVAGVAMGDLMDGQDLSVMNPVDQDDRTGFATEASFVFIENSAGTVDSIEQAVALDVDIINMSSSVNYNCDLAGASNDAVDAAMLAGIFFSKSSGSNGVIGAACNIGTPGAASGAFSVAAIDRAAVPLVSGLVTSGSSHGPDVEGRAVVALAAVAGPEGATAAGFNNMYGAFGATSAAAPVVAGSAAFLKEHLLTVFSSMLINDAGYLYAAMLVMGDGQMDAGVALAQEEMDGKWGAGRLRLRKFDNAGMDAPWRMRLIGRTISDGAVVSDLLLNPDVNGINQDIPTSADRIRATVFWHEPNIEDPATAWATISSTLCNDDGFCYGSGNSGDPRQRHRIGNVTGGKKWWLKLSGIDVPASADTNYRFGLDERMVHVAVYWEDEARNDADGPTADIQ
jgi:hypothetical protein